MSDSLDRDELELLESLLGELAAGDLSAEAATKLERLLAGDPQSVWRYIQTMHLCAGLQWQNGDSRHLSENSYLEDDEFEPVKQCGASASLAPRDSVRLAANLSRGQKLMAIAAGLLVVVTGALWGTWSQRTGNRSTEEIAIDSFSTQGAAATVVSISPDCKWVSDEGRLSNGKGLAAGHQIRITNGRIDLRFGQGAEVFLNGPAAFTVTAENSGYLILGGLTANVPDSAIGFLVDTPHGKVVDLGTEFGVVVDDFGSAEVGVFKGKVLTHVNQAQEAVELAEGDSLQWGLGTATHAVVSPRRYDRGLSHIGFVDEQTPFAELVLEDDFNDRQLNMEQWKTLGHVSEKDGGIQLGRDRGEGERGNVPYLLTTREFDPSKGCLVITGTVRFSNPLDLKSGALSVFTRAEDGRGTFPRPEYAYLGTGVRSTFWPVSTVAGETLRVLVRPLPAAENVGLLGEEFEASGDSSEWKFQVIDDGVNLSLTVAQTDNPAVMKTVHARSLFNGSANYIALEGDPITSILLDNIKIFQVKKQPDRLDRTVHSAYFDDKGVCSLLSLTGDVFALLR